MYKSDALISIIVPVYNVENYLKKCIDSIIAQTYHNLEIILVNDGSTDLSGQICNECAKRDSRIHVYYKENGGLSSARNFGIEKSNGDYIGFVDSDDYIAEDMYDFLLNEINRHDTDMAICGVGDIYNGKLIEPKKCVSFQSPPEEVIKFVLEAEVISVQAWNKLYKKSLFDYIRFPVGKTAEDAFVMIEILDKCRRIAVNTSVKYYYVHRKNSITTRSFSEHDFDPIEAYKKNYDIVNKKYPALVYQAEMRLCWAYFYVLDRMVINKNVIKSHKERFNECKEYLSEHFWFIIKDRYFCTSRKFALCVLMIHVDLYKMLVIAQRNKLGI